MLLDLLSNAEIARALVSVVGATRWEAVVLAKGILAQEEGATAEDAARVAFEAGPLTLKACRAALAQLPSTGFRPLLTERTRRGSAENPMTKLFPARITEQRFEEQLINLGHRRAGVGYRDERTSGHTLLDFSVIEGEATLPINVKNAGTRFERAPSLVGLDPDDCLPIPAYKAHGAIEEAPELVYVVCADYELLAKLDAALPALFSEDERIVWDLLNGYTGPQVRAAEDVFVNGIVSRNWPALREMIDHNPFHVISARRAIRVLHTKPKRTPGIGLRAWGTGASAEVNVHVSIAEDTTPWEDVADRIVKHGVRAVISAVNRMQTEEVHDPEI